jgi:hypothetical protein
MSALNSATLALALVTAALALSTCVSEARADCAVQLHSWDPPAEYYKPYWGTLIIRRLPQKQVAEECAAIKKQLGKYSGKITECQRGCAYWQDRSVSCTIIMIDKPFLGTHPEAVYRHEIAHCNGWPADHPGSWPRGLKQLY